MKPKLSVIDNVADLLKALNTIAKAQVLVGIPAEENSRSEGPIGNAALLAIHNFGSPVNGIPARPVMAIGIRRAQKEIADEFKKAAQRALSKGASAVSAAYQRAGIIASNSVKKVINDQIGIEPPAASTLAARKARGFKGTKALIVTAQLRNSITYVVKE
jgi:metal-dependent amidase/aminoacylase/carboxypeptidase family protein